MKVVHLTDIHFFRPPPPWRLMGKRALGTANLYLGRRRHHFSLASQRAAIAKAVELKPDLVLITGDLTSQALEAEFDLAYQELSPLLEMAPSLVIPGNHDVYTRGAAKERRIEKRFGRWMHKAEGQSVGRLDVDNVTALGLDPNRPTGMHASGELPAEQLSELQAILDDDALDGRFIILALHYPILDRHGAVYDGAHHGLVNARALMEVLAATRNAPQMAVHGHVHHGFRIELSLGGKRRFPVFNSGSSGYAYLPKQRRAGAMNLYDIEPTLERRTEAGPAHVERFLFDGGVFAPEPGGAYSTGR